MVLDELVKKNEDLIERFNVKAYLEAKNFAVVGAIAALEITNEVQKNFVKNIDIPQTEDEMLMHLYGMLQALFVSVDGLYALAYELSGSKKFININQNADMRELKHIRNDVVGHPANRNIRTQGNAYCILQKEKLSTKEFTYFICSDRKIEERKVDLVSLIKSYYIEANALLKVLFNISNSGIANERLFELMEKVLRAFPNNDYLSKLDSLYNDYLLKYPDATKKQDRFVWRYELIKKIINYDFNSNDELIEELKNDIIYMELEKTYTLLAGKPFFDKYIHSYGTLVKSMYRFLRKNNDLYSIKDYLCDMSHPLFYDTFLKFKSKARLNPTVSIYLSCVNTLIEKNDSDLVYAYMLPVKNFKKK